MLGVQNNLRVTICRNTEDAVEKGYDYKGKNITPLEIHEAVVVLDGTEQHRSTVDLRLRDADGKEYVVMVTARLLKSIPTIT